MIRKIFRGLFLATFWAFNAAMLLIVGRIAYLALSNEHAGMLAVLFIAALVGGWAAGSAVLYMLARATRPA